MCRYAGFRTEYKTSFVCVPCRHVAQYLPENQPRCPFCHTDLVNAGRDFKAPRKQNTQAWRAVGLVLAMGKKYDSCGCVGPGWRPHTAAEFRQTQVDRAQPIL